MSEKIDIDAMMEDLRASMEDTRAIMAATDVLRTKAEAARTEARAVRANIRALLSEHFSPQGSSAPATDGGSSQVQPDRAAQRARADETQNKNSSLPTRSKPNESRALEANSTPAAGVQEMAESGHRRHLEAQAR